MSDTRILIAHFISTVLRFYYGEMHINGPRIINNLFLLCSLLTVRCYAFHHSKHIELFKNQLKTVSGVPSNKQKCKEKQNLRHLTKEAWKIRSQDLIVYVLIMVHNYKKDW